MSTEMTNDKEKTSDNVYIEALHDKPSIFDDLKATIAQDAMRLKHTTCVSLPHEQLMADLLTQVKKVDYRARSEFDPEDDNSKIKRAHYLIITVEVVLELTLNNRWKLCRRGGFFYAYNKAFWKKLEKDDIKDFLRKAAEKMGVDKFIARHYEYGDQLFRQFVDDAYLPTPVINKDVININLQNGTFEISTENQKLRLPQADDFLTHQLDFAYDPQASAPRFLTFLNRVQPDQDCQKILAEYLGYIFISSAKLKLEKTLLLYGSGANGKSVFFEIITALLGKENVSHYSLHSLTTDPSYCRAHLGNKLVNYASEINGKLEVDAFKQLVSGEPIEARLPHGQPFILTDYAKLIFNCNELPSDVEHSNAYFRRFLIVPFTVTIPEKEQDKQLADKIIESELSGVFNWILSGLKRLLLQNRFTDAKAVREQLDAYKQQSDSIRLFLDESEYRSDPNNYVFLKELYRDYREYCAEDGLYPVKKLNFHKRLQANGLSTNRLNVGNVVYISKKTMPYQK